MWLWCWFVLQRPYEHSNSHNLCNRPYQIPAGFSHPFPADICRKDPRHNGVGLVEAGRVRGMYQKLVIWYYGRCTVTICRYDLKILPCILPYTWYFIHIINIIFWIYMLLVCYSCIIPVESYVFLWVPKHHSPIPGFFWASGLESKELSRRSVWASLSFREDAIEGLATVAMLLISLHAAVQELPAAGVSGFRGIDVHVELFWDVLRHFTLQIQQG